MIPESQDRHPACQSRSDKAIDRRYVRLKRVSYEEWTSGLPLEMRSDRQDAYPTGRFVRGANNGYQAITNRSFASCTIKA
ncbi:MAG: hypothetical protein JWN70_3433 [Planctomycetaceae bacterium]|nr:hypothetical protein [Planctomycetaceae bacterium]